MDIVVQLAFDENAALRLLNWLAQENARIIKQYDESALREGAPWRALPGLYESGVRYEREKGEIWGDVINVYAIGVEDCDALSAIRAGELMARGWRALRPNWQTLYAQGLPLPEDYQDRYPGDEGYDLAMKLKPESIKAEVYLKTNAEPGRPGLYHCVTRYWIGGREFRDDPSARLGMLRGVSQEARQGLTGRAKPSRIVTLQGSWYEGGNQGARREVDQGSWKQTWWDR